MAEALSRGTRIGRPLADGTLTLGTVIGPAFGEGWYRAKLTGPDSTRIVCLHVSEVLVDPVFADLSAAAAALLRRDQRTAPAAEPRRATGGAF